MGKKRFIISNPLVYKKKKNADTQKLYLQGCTARQQQFFFYSLLKLILHLQLLNVDHIVSTQKYLYVTTLEVMYIEVVRKTGNRCLAVHVSRWGDPTFPLLILTHLKNFRFKNKMNNMTFHFWLWSVVIWEVEILLLFFTFRQRLIVSREHLPNHECIVF